jgi:hypothetical protein
MKKQVITSWMILNEYLVDFIAGTTHKKHLPSKKKGKSEEKKAIKDESECPQNKSRSDCILYCLLLVLSSCEV